MRLCPAIRYFNALSVYLFYTEGISGIKYSAFYRLMPMSLLLGASETDVVSSCRDVRGVGVKSGHIEALPLADAV